MLTDHDRQNIKTLINDRDKDITYRNWTKRVLVRIKHMTSLDDPDLNKNIKMLKLCLKDLESIYKRRILLLSNVSIADKHGCAVSTVERIGRERETGLSDYLHKKYDNDELKFPERRQA